MNTTTTDMPAPIDTTTTYVSALERRQRALDALMAIDGVDYLTAARALNYATQHAQRSPEYDVTNRRA